MTVETVTYISDLNDDYPGEAETGTLHEGNNHIRNIKKGILATFPNVTGAVTATHTELNYCDITTLGTMQASKALTASAGNALTTSGTLTIASGGVINIESGGAVQIGGSAITATAAEINSLAGSNVKDVTGDGYWKLPGGFIVQWGSKTSSGTSANNAAITFPFEFPTAALRVLTNVSGGGSVDGTFTIQTGAATTTGCQCTTYLNGSKASGMVVLWLAIGY